MKESVNARRHTRRTKKDTALLESVSSVWSVIAQNQERSKLEADSLKFFMSYLASLHTVAVLAVRAVVKTEQFYRKDMMTVQSFSSQLTKIKTMIKLLWPLLILISRNVSLFDEEQRVLVQNTAIILPFDNRRSTSESPDADDPFLAHFESLETQNVSYFSLFAIWYRLRNYKFLFVNIKCRL